MNNVFPLKNPGLSAVVFHKNAVGIYTDTGMLYYMKKYSGNWEAKRGAETLAKILNENSNRGILNVVDVLSKKHIKIDCYVHYSSTFFGTSSSAGLKKYDPMLDSTLED